MALKKQEISLNLVIGGDTKVNEQIDKDFKEMVNITLSGDMTAKKADGISLLKTLPMASNVGADPSVNYSLISKCGPDLLAFSEKGAYKKIDSNSYMKKIDSAGMVGIDFDQVKGSVFAIGTSYKFVVDLSNHDKYIFYTYQLDGILVEKKTTFCSGNQFADHKIVANGDDFYFLGTGLPSSPLSSRATIYKNGSFHGVLSMDNTISEGTFDMIYGNGFLYLSYVLNDLLVTQPVFTKLIKYNVATATNIEVNTSTDINTRANAILTNKDANALYVTFTTTDNLSGTEYFVLRQIEVGKTSLTLITPSTILDTIQRHNQSLTLAGFLTATAINLSSCAFAIFERVKATLAFVDSICHSGVTGLGPTAFTTGIEGKGKPFSMGGDWYLPSKITFGTQEITSLLKFPYFGETSMIPSLTSLYGQTATDVMTSERIPNRATNESYSLSGDYFFASDSVNASAILKTSIDPKQKNGSIEIGGNLVTFGAQMGYFDGVDYSEMGFIGKPWIASAVSNAGSLPASTYQFVVIYTWEDGRGNIFRSAESNIRSLVTGGSSSFDLEIIHPLITTKQGVRAEVYIRSTNKLFQLVTSYVVSKEAGTLYNNSIVTISAYPDPTSPFLYTEPNAREATTPLNAICMALYGDRLFYVSQDDLNMVRFSKIKQLNVGFEFPQDFRIQILDKRGFNEDQITGLQAMDGRLLIFKEQSVLFTYGQGPADDGSKNDFIDPQLVSTDVGCINQRSIILMPDGVMFMSQKGIYVIGRNLAVEYIGSPVEQFNNLTITSAILADEVNEIRFTSLEGTVLVYNYFSKQWTWWTGRPTQSTCTYKEKQTFLIGDKIGFQDSTTKKIFGAFQTQKIASPWVRLKEIQGYQKAYLLNIIGTYKTKHKMIVNVFYDYEKFSSETYEIDPLSADQYNIVTRPTNEELENGTKTNGVYQLRIDLIRKNCEAVRVEITDSSKSFADNSGECFALSNLTFTIGVKNGTYKLPAKKSY